MHWRWQCKESTVGSKQISTGVAFVEPGPQSAQQFGAETLKSDIFGHTS